MAKPRRTRLTRPQRLYRFGQRWLRRLHLRACVDYHVCEIRISPRHAAGPTPGDAETIRISEAGPDQWHWLAPLEDERAEHFPVRWQRGHRCFTANVNGLCAGYVWVATGPTWAGDGDGLLTWQVPAHAAWIYDAFFHPLVLGTYPDLLNYVRTCLWREQMQWLCGQIEFDNNYSRRLHDALGGRHLGWAAILRLGPLRLRAVRHPHQGWRPLWHRRPIPLIDFLQPAAAGAPGTRLPARA